MTCWWPCCAGGYNIARISETGELVWGALHPTKPLNGRVTRIAVDGTNGWLYSRMTYVSSGVVVQEFRKWNISDGSEVTNENWPIERVNDTQPLLTDLIVDSGKLYMSIGRGISRYSSDGTKDYDVADPGLGPSFDVSGDFIWTTSQGVGNNSFTQYMKSDGAFENNGPIGSSGFNSCTVGSSWFVCRGGTTFNSAIRENVDGGTLGNEWPSPFDNVVAFNIATDGTDLYALITDFYGTWTGPVGHVKMTTSLVVTWERNPPGPTIGGGSDGRAAAWSVDSTGRLYFSTALIGQEFSGNLGRRDASGNIDLVNWPFLWQSTGYGVTDVRFDDSDNVYACGGVVP